MVLNSILLNESLRRSSDGNPVAGIRTNRVAYDLIAEAAIKMYSIRSIADNHVARVSAVGRAHSIDAVYIIKASHLASLYGNSCAEIDLNPPIDPCHSRPENSVIGTIKRDVVPLDDDVAVLVLSQGCIARYVERSR